LESVSQNAFFRPISESQTIRSYLRSRSERGALNGPLSRFLRFLLDNDNDSDFAAWTMEAWETPLHA
jgi:hypothetical protein